MYTNNKNLKEKERESDHSEHLGKRLPYQNPNIFGKQNSEYTNRNERQLAVSVEYTGMQ